MNVIYHPKVEEVIHLLSKEDGSRITKVVDLFIDYRFRLTQIYLKKITKGIWELRAGRYRLLFGMIDSQAVVVNIFMKKSQKTPIQAIVLAVKRLKEYET
ncbi:type II toxin-antitoxin system RelE/ParE family toxin [Candidatus Gottesmanbacteria bacterium]|nr:type II toxin-antitoxin system RelE/ParE family toxin [Candidatus Gottesmanbacteria bacterium]